MAAASATRSRRVARRAAAAVTHWTCGLSVAALLVGVASPGALPRAAAQSTTCTPQAGTADGAGATAAECWIGDLDALTAYPTSTPYPTATFYPTSTPYPTFTPLPTPAGEVAEVSPAPSLPALTTPAATSTTPSTWPDAASTINPAATTTPLSAAPAASGGDAGQVAATPAPPEPVQAPPRIPDVPATPTAVLTATALAGTPAVGRDRLANVVTSATPAPLLLDRPANPAAAITALELPLASPPEYEVEPGPDALPGYFYSQAAGGRGGYILTGDLWSLVQRLGGVSSIGYPVSRVWLGVDGFSYQATQGTLLQWSPSTGARLANTFQILEAAGRDDWLLLSGIPRPVKDDGSSTFDEATSIRLGWLMQPEIAERYWAAGPAAVEQYGLPMSQPERFGPFVAQRFQRVAFQYWVESVPGMPPPGTVSVVLGGDLLKQAGLVPADASVPIAPPLHR